MGVRVALVGAGRMGRAHLRALERSERLRPTAIADPSPQARAAAKEEGLPAYESVPELLASASVDAAIVASPTDTHLEVVRTLADAGLPVLCEKPCGRSSEESLAAGEAAERAGVPLQVGYWKRFVPVLQGLRRRIAGGQLGDISLVGCFQWDDRPPSAAFRTRSGGPVVDMGVHEFDLMRWLTGQEVVAAAGFASTVSFDPPVEGDPESVALVVRLSGGALGIVSLGRRFTRGDAHRVEVIGTEGAEDHPFVWPPTEVEDFMAALAAQAESFADAVEGAPVAGATASEAAAALEAAARAEGGLRDG